MSHPPVNLWSGFEPNGQEEESLGQGIFLRLSRHTLRNRYADGATSEWYWVEAAHPPFLDAVVLLLFVPAPADRDPLAASRVLLRRAPRPAAFLRGEEPLLAAMDGERLSGGLWELPAGGVERGDLLPGGGGVVARARREAFEEGGFRLAPSDLLPLGPAPFSAPAICGERLHYFAAAVDPAHALPPPGDGHPLERGAELRFLPLEEALDWCREGRWWTSRARWPAARPEWLARASVILSGRLRDEDPVRALGAALLAGFAWRCRRRPNRPPRGRE